MQFLCNSESEYDYAINELLDQSIFDYRLMEYSLDIDPEGKVGVKPYKYPVVVSMDIDNFYSNIRNTDIINTKFLYLDDVLEADELVDGLNDLQKLENIADDLAREYDAGLASVEYVETMNRINELESRLF